MTAAEETMPQEEVATPIQEEKKVEYHESVDSLLSNIRFDISHQEMARITAELEKTFNYFAFNDEGPSGVEWLPINGTEEILREELGYEDTEEFQDAIKCPFNEFLHRLPHIKMKTENGKQYWSIIQDPSEESWKPRILRYTVSKPEDLWRVVFKNKRASFAIPKLEYENCADGQRQVDTIYNHIASAMYHLGSHAARTMASDSHVASKINETVEELSSLLDLKEPFEIVVDDPMGVSEIFPMDGVSVEHYEWVPLERGTTLEELLEGEEDE